MSGPDSFAALLDEMTRDWRVGYPSASIVLAGMVGSTLGWIDAGYMRCPLPASELALARTQLGDGTVVSIVRGLSCTNPTGSGDVMRGEEVELAGLLRLKFDLNRGNHVVCLPGTHSKWANLQDGTVTNFTTAVTGELFAALRTSGVLVAADTPLPEHAGSGFAEGVASILDDPGSLLSLLFTVRVRQIEKADTAETAIERLSGLIVGADIAARLEQLQRLSEPVVIIANRALCSRYAAAFDIAGVDHMAVSAQAATVAGLWGHAMNGESAGRVGG